MRLAVRAWVSDAALPAGGEILYPLHSHAHKFIIHIVFTICSHKNISYIYIYLHMSRSNISHTHTKLNMSWMNTTQHLSELNKNIHRPIASKKNPGIRWSNLFVDEKSTLAPPNLAYVLCCIHFCQHNLLLTLPKTNTTHWTWMVGRLLSSWEGLFSGAKMLLPGRVVMPLRPAGHRCASWQSCHLDPVRRKEYRQVGVIFIKFTWCFGKNRLCICGR